MIRQLTTADAADFLKIRREALERAPLAFGSSPEEDFVKSLGQANELLNDSYKAVFGAFSTDLIGMVGVRRQERKRERHKADIWGMYVREDHRGRGYGRRLMEAAITFARALQGVRLVHLAVTNQAATAEALYETLGFVVWGIEEAGLHVDGADLTRKHMVLML